MGTTVFARFGYSHIDRQPLGDIAGVIHTLITCNPGLDFVYTHRVEDEQFVADTRDMKSILNGVPLSDMQVSLWLKEFLQEGISNLHGGA